MVDWQIDANRPRRVTRSSLTWVLVTCAHGQTADGDTIAKAMEFVAVLRVLTNDVLAKLVECED